jgi:hypothetical protein
MKPWLRCFSKTAQKAIPNTFFHPDFTVGLGFSPSQSLPKSWQRVAGSDVRSSLPPVGTFTLP